MLCDKATGAAVADTVPFALLHRNYALWEAGTCLTCVTPHHLWKHRGVLNLHGVAMYAILQFA